MMQSEPMPPPRPDAVAAAARDMANRLLDTFVAVAGAYAANAAPGGDGGFVVPLPDGAPDPRPAHDEPGRTASGDERSGE